MMQNLQGTTLMSPPGQAMQSATGAASICLGYMLCVLPWTIYKIIKMQAEVHYLKLMHEDQDIDLVAEARHTGHDIQELLRG